MVRCIEGADKPFLSKDALSVMTEEITKVEHPVFTILGNRKHFGLIQENDRIFFVEHHTTEEEMLEIFIEIVKQRKRGRY